MQSMLPTLGFNNRQVAYRWISGVYVAVLDTGLLKTWRNYFPQERIAVDYGIGRLAVAVARKGFHIYPT
jgi:hypothetical protein